MNSGYSKHTLVEKLGLVPYTRCAVVNAPVNYIDALGKLPRGIIIEGAVSGGKYAFIQYFTAWREDVAAEFPRFKSHLDASGMLWISWPKKAAKMISNLDENMVRNIGLKNGLVDTKVIAVDEIWSGLKFVFRLTDRPKR